MLDYKSSKDRPFGSQECSSPLIEFTFVRLKALIHEGLKGVNDKEAYILVRLHGLDDGQRRTLDKVGQDLEVTRERIRQIKNRAIAALRRDVVAIAPFQRAYNETLNFSERLGSAPDDPRFAPAFARASGSHPSDACAISGYMRLLLAIFESPHQSRRRLEPVDTLAVSTIIERGNTLSLNALQAALDADADARRILQDWQKLDISLRLNIVFGIEMDSSERLIPTERTYAGISTKQHRLAVINRVLLEEGTSLHFREIARRIKPLLSNERAMSPRNVHAWLDRYKTRFKWVGPGTYGLASWDIGVRDRNIADNLRSARRTGIGDEIALMLAESGRPMHLKTIEEHIINRFKIKRSSIPMSIVQDKAGRFTLNANGAVGLSIWNMHGTNGNPAKQLTLLSDDKDE